MPPLSIAIFPSRLNETLIGLVRRFSTLDHDVTPAICRRRNDALVPLSSLRILTFIDSLRLFELRVRLGVLNLLVLLLHVSCLHSFLSV